jgi:hypothetical protein
MMKRNGPDSHEITLQLSSGLGKPKQQGGFRGGGGGGGGRGGGGGSGGGRGGGGGGSEERGGVRAPPLVGADPSTRVVFLPPGYSRGVDYRGSPHRGATVPGSAVATLMGDWRHRLEPLVARLPRPEEQLVNVRDAWDDGTLLKERKTDRQTDRQMECLRASCAW